MADSMRHVTAVVIGSGFGGTMIALSLARAFARRGRNESILMLERGTWWTTPVSTVQDKEVKTYDFLATTHKQPVQYWSSQNHFGGFIDIFTRCFRRGNNADGLYDFTWLGRRRLFRNENDGVSIVRASGVGGGSLVYSNITMRPPDLVFDDTRWPLSWTAAERDDYYETARDAIGLGVLHALEQRDLRRGAPAPQTPAKPVNAGLSNIVTRSARLAPHWHQEPDPNNPRRATKQIRPTPLLPAPPAGPANPDPEHRLWIDRARTFQTAVSELTPDFGTVDSSINDLPPEGSPLDPMPPKAFDGKPVNYCERQGRCNVGCLPGARHTLNKQLMAAIFGKPDGTPPTFSNLLIEPLAEVDVVEATGGGYFVHYAQRDHADPSRTTPAKVKADVVIMAAGCVGTNEILLRSQARGMLPGLSDKTGFGFSTNGDYIAFLEDTKERVSLTRGPVTTSFGHFHTKEPLTGGDPSQFHTLEDQGVPPVLASVLGMGVPLLRSLAKGRERGVFVVLSILFWVLKKIVAFVRAPFLNSQKQQEAFRSSDEISSHMMCVVGMGLDKAVGQFRLGTGSGDSSLRVKRTDGVAFHEDSIYKSINRSLGQLAKHLSSDPQAEFTNPFLGKPLGAVRADGIAVSHPLGGCRIARDVGEGVVDEFGRVFDKLKNGARPYYDGLYLADGAIIPTALGVNPSLTISALALRIGDQVIADLGP